MSLREALAEGLDALELDLSDPAQQKLLDYLALIEKWNRVYNLTAVREPQKMLAQHLFDSLAVVPHMQGETIADVGSGAGLPGIPLALALPLSHVTLVESSQKKSTFLSQAVIELALTNVDVAATRVEAHDGGVFDCVISRAFSDLAEFVALAGHLCKPDGVLMAMKGVHPYDELAQLPEGFRTREVRPLTVPGLDAKRHLVLIDRV
jgi:16S rRNA (guanine527-N7)-methyltransferase